MTPDRRAQAQRATVATVLAGVAVGAGAATLTEVVWSGSWLPLLLGALAAVVAAVAGTRWLVLTVPRYAPGPALRALPTVVGTGLALLLWFWLGTSTDPDAAGVGGSPVHRTLTELGKLHQLAADSVAPVNATAPVVVGALGAALVLYLLADLLVVELHAPVAVAAPALVLWLPALVIEARVPVLSVAVTVVALLCLLAVDRAGVLQERPQGRRRGTPPLAGGAGVLAGAAAITAVSLALGAAATALPGAGGKPLAHLFSTSSGSGRLGNDLNVLNDLGEQPSAAVLHVSSAKGTEGIGPLQVFTLTRFDGKTWQPDPAVTGARVSSDDLLWPASGRDGSRTAPRTAGGKPTAAVTIQPEFLPRGRLAVPTEPRTVSSTAPVRYDPQRDEVYRATGDPRASYTLSVYDRGLTAKSLSSQRAGFADDSPVPDRERTQSLAIPRTSHIADVTALAQKITAPAHDDYEKALLLQTYFRNANVFTYSTKAPRAATGDPVWDFLLARSGYCVQYATAMTIMLRTLGIPARVGVGYLTHPVPPGGTSDVTGHDAHAWPEVYFADSGWVRFEPTPAVQTGATPSWADPYNGSPTVSQPNDALHPGAVSEPQPVAGASDAATPESRPSSIATHTQPGDSWGGTRLVTAIVVVVGLLALAVAAWWRRARSRRRELAGPEEAWEHLRRRLEAVDVSWPDSATPRQVPELVAASVRNRTDQGLRPGTTHSLEALADELQRARYARRGPGGEPSGTVAATDVDLANLVDDVVAGVQEALNPKPAARA